MPDRSPSRTGLDPNVAAALAYTLGWITGIAFLLTERSDSFVRFHAMQSTIVFATLSLVCVLLQSIPLLGMLLAVFVVIPLSAVLWLVLMFKAYKGERFKVPFAGEMAEQRI
ncbi:MAG TPA: DUF4870 domain-containing protein [Vicinamibacterales bacterium]|nr:DUF4870 domain-containing protein [Vicinamibacterales bacterium]